MSTFVRHDYAFPFRIEPGSHQPKRAPYEAHVAQMVRQLLLTSPGERANLPEFGCGLRALVFAPNTGEVPASVRGLGTDALATTVDMLVRQALVRWLADHLEVRRVEVRSEDATLHVLVEYVLRTTHRHDAVQVRVR